MKRPRILRRVRSSSDQPEGNEAGGARDTSPTEQKRPDSPPPPAHPVDPHERIDGLRAWLAQVDRKVGVRTYAIGAAAVLALAAGIVGIVLALNAKEESATTEEVQALRANLRAVEQEASAAAEEQVSELVDRVGTLERRVSRLSRDQTMSGREVRAIENEIEDLRDQIADLDGLGGGADGGDQGGG